MQSRVFIREKGTQKDTHRRPDMIAEAELWGPTGQWSHQRQEKAGRSPWGLWRGHGSANTSTSDLWPQSRESISVLFSATQPVEMCHISCRKLIHTHPKFSLISQHKKALEVN